MTVAWDPDFYQTGYEGFERSENFLTTQALDDDRRLLLDKTESQIEFIARHKGTRHLQVVEFGSGNGRLLVALALRGMLAVGIGIEISQSRVAFARRWSDDLQLALNEGKLRLWQPLPPEDRFAFYLDDFEYWSEQKILRHTKIFIDRDGIIDARRQEVLAYYTDSELVNLLHQSGFGHYRIYEDFNDAPYREGQSAALVALAEAAFSKRTT